MFNKVQTVTDVRRAMSRPEPPPEAALIRLVREAAGISAPEAARNAGISVARWSQIELGYESRKDTYKPVRAQARTLAHMAWAVRLSPQRLEAAGRPDAAMILREMLRSDEEDRAGHARQGPRGDDALSPEERQLMEDFRDFLIARREQRTRNDRPA